MKFLNVIVPGLIVLSFAQCRRGCTDPEATNFEAGAKKDNGSCIYSGDPEDFDRGPMLSNLADNVILPAYLDLKNELTGLKNAMDVFEANPNSNTISDLRSAWILALNSWQHAAYFEFGPAETHFLRANMNVYPTDTAQINGNIQSGTYDLNAAVNLDAKGFQALDYLLNGVGNAESEIVDQYTTDTYATSRMAYLKDLIEDMLTRTTTVHAAWEVSGGNYVTTFKNNTSLSIGGSCNLLFNAFVMHYEQYVRSGKLGIPAGALSFSQTPLPEKVECYYHGYQSKNMMVEANMALNDLYNGNGNHGNGIGFKEYLDYLKTNGPNGLLANDINDQIQLVLDNVTTGLNEPLSDFVVDHQSTALSVWSEMQTLVVLLKNDLKSAIGLSITYADADGD